MKAVRFHAARDVRVEEVAPPSGVLLPDDVLVEPFVTGICGTDLHEYVAGPIVTPATPHAYTGATNPQILGHEFSARVKAVGSAVSHVKAGDRISVQPLLFPRDDYFGKRGLYHLSPKMACVGLSWAWGGMAEQAVIKDYNAQPVSNSLTDEQAAMIEPAAVAMYGVDRGGVTAGSTVLVSGAGPIGALTILGAKAAGASVIIVSEPNPNRRRIISEIAPFAVVIDPKTQNLLEVVRDLTEEGVGVDVALECVGLEASLNACVDAVRRQGKVVQVGLHIKRASIDAMQWALKDITLEATWCYPVQIWPRIARLIASGTFPVERVITARIDAADVVSKGFEALLDPAGNHLKIVVRT
ncbi:2,3-butanediol dehydrogenase [Devosia psychrophila]|uniref:(R,R)-butanediol dehydrogenase / meso-butanediol dehydrogenase / diacetyl reductase n=1 Tax=Devosia psychrophila TaxID=728005 RepID=A0A0F5Q2C2_9HYPH|nr:2,3-butanediol dehydrogenase [Devosia psychrophila]KKC34229.1 zinc-binding dehydrogenase [Devosia psychrophila]SFD27016.1 (R,R)-butanediol dehydrogenase / meso-butanediol dehydrogenase / diacetyl reductase [Devosia psychrophila]